MEVLAERADDTLCKDSMRPRDGMLDEEILEPLLEGCLELATVVCVGVIRCTQGLDDGVQSSSTVFRSLALERDHRELLGEGVDGHEGVSVHLRRRGPKICQVELELLEGREGDE